MREQIINKACQLFLTAGFSSVTMDDLAREMAVSKKTIYKFYENKKQIVEQVAFNAEKQLNDRILCVMDSEFNAVEEYFEIRKLFAEMIQVIGISQLYQLRKKYPDIYDYIKTSEHDIYNIFMIRNLSKGIKEGYFNDDIEVNDYIFFYQSIRFYITKDIVSRQKRHQLEFSAMIYHLNALCTEKGRAELERQLKLTNTTI